MARNSRPKKHVFSSPTPSTASEHALLPLGALMLAASVTSWAQAPADKTLAPVVVKEKAEAQQGKDALQTRQTTIGKGTQDIRDIPQSITVMTEKLIDDRRLDTLREALHHTAGITFAATENGTDQDIRLRGFPLATVGDLLIDGMRDPSQYDRDAFNYDRIEVMRGSASMLFGRGSTGGVVNQVTKQPFLLNQHDVDLSVGNRGYVRTTGDFNFKTGEESAFRLNVMANKADNGGAKVDKYGIAPTYRWGIGTRDEFSVGLFYLDVDNVPPAGIRWLTTGIPGQLSGVPNIKAGNYYGTDSDYLTGRASYATFKHTHRFDSGELRTQVRTGTFDRAQWGTTAGFAAGTTAANLSNATVLTRVGLSPRMDQYDGTYAQSDYSTTTNWFGVKNEIIAGIDYSIEEAQRYGAWGTVGTNFNKGNTTVGTPDDGTVLAAAPAYRATNDYKSRSMGAYFQDVVQVAPAWKVLAGLRYDRFDGDFRNNTYANATTNVPNGRQVTGLADSLFSHRFGVLYQPTPSQSYHFSYGTSFNTSADTYQYVTPQNANTPPEKSRNIEIGAKLDWLERQLSTRVAVFRTEKFNERTTDSDFAGTSYLLSGARHTAGVEFDVVGRLSPQWEVYASYSWTPVAKIDKAGSTALASVGQRVGLTPKHSGSVWLSYQATPKLRVAAGANGASANYPLQGTSGAASTTARAAGYVVGDIMGEYKITADTYVQLNVTNITDKVYGDQLYPGFVIAGAPRTVKLTVGTRF